MDAMLASIGARQFAEWQAFSAVEPFGYEAESSMPAGIVASVVANCNRAPGDPAFTPGDFMPGKQPEAPEQDADGRSAAIMALLVQAEASQ